jgi:hypothetical protein
MKWWQILIGLAVVWLVVALVVPPNIRCRLTFWDKNACANINQSANMLTKLGYEIDPNEPLITQPGAYKGVGDIVGKIGNA